MVRRARETGLFAVLRDEHLGGLSSLGGIRVTGRDAARFLHAQLTNEVNALGPGEGNLTARVTRSGHLVEILSLRRLPSDTDGCAAFLLLMEKRSVAPLLEELERFLFGDDVTLTDVTSDFTWINVQGPSASAALRTALAEVPDTEYHGVTQLQGNEVPPGTLLISHSMAGDLGFIVALPGPPGSAGGLLARLERAAKAENLVCPTGETLEQVLDVLRIEAGIIRSGIDTPGRKRLLPETCLESQLVSYTKGCYLGQEVITRVRAYGSLPFELRGLVLEACHSDQQLRSMTESLTSLPEIGEDLFLDDGTKVGQIVSRTLSPTLNRAVAMAYLDRAHRTPGTRLSLKGSRGSVTARVALLPLYRDERYLTQASTVYEHAVQIFGNGQEERALALLEKALTIDPTFADAYEAIGVVLGRFGRWEEAIGIFERLEELAPEEPMVSTNLSLSYMKIGDKVRAEEHAARAMRKSIRGDVAGGNSDNGHITALQHATRREEAVRKQEMFSKVLEVDPNDPIALFGLGNAFSTLEEWEKAERSYARAMLAQKGNAAVFLARGKALERLGKVKEAVAVYREGRDVASRKGDMLPLREIETRLILLDQQEHQVTL